MPKNAVDACIICGEVKCCCGKPARLPTPKRKRAPAAPAAALPLPSPPPEDQPVQQASSEPDPWDDAPTVKESARAAMKARAARSRQPQPARVTTADPIEAAIKVLLPILHPDDRVKYGKLANQHSDVSLRAATWRQRRTNA